MTDFNLNKKKDKKEENDFSLFIKTWNNIETKHNTQVLRNFLLALIIFTRTK